MSLCPQALLLPGSSSCPALPREEAARSLCGGAADRRLLPARQGDFACMHPASPAGSCGVAACPAPCADPGHRMAALLAPRCFGISRSSGRAWPRGCQLDPSNLLSDGPSWQVQCCLSAPIHHLLPEGKSSPSQGDGARRNVASAHQSSAARRRRGKRVFSSSPSRPVITGASDFLRLLQGEHKGR